MVASREILSGGLEPAEGSLVDLPDAKEAAQFLYRNRERRFAEEDVSYWYDGQPENISRFMLQPGNEPRQFILEIQDDISTSEMVQSWYLIVRHTNCYSVSKILESDEPPQIATDYEKTRVHGLLRYIEQNDKSLLRKIGKFIREQNKDD